MPVLPASASDSSDLVVLCEVAAVVGDIQSRFPSVQVIDISGGVPHGVRGEVLFGGRSPHSARAVATGVRWVHVQGTGLDGVQPEVVAAPLLTVSRGASAVPISEYVIASMGAFARNFPDNWIREPPEKWSQQPASTLAGKTLALFGFGGIAQRVARIALSMDMSVVALRRRVAPSPVNGVEMVHSLHELLAIADHVVLAAPATELTYHVINADSLASMKPGAHLVNIARGTLVNQESLRVALDNGIVARASLDVTDPEPLPAGHWLFDHPHVFLTPHASWGGPPYLKISVEQFCENLARYLAGEALRGVVGGEGY